ncbi:MAG: DUF222 domain-containing protein [Egibacteraceae bacterium]
MSSIQAIQSVLEGLSGEALLDVIQHGLMLLGGEALGEELDDSQLAGRVEWLHRVETMAAAEKLRCVAEVDARQAWRGEGARSTADLLARRLRLTRGEARSQTETAVGLASLPETSAALRAGTIGLGQAQVAAQTAKDLRPDVREELDQLVAGEGGGLDRRQLRQRVDEWTHTVDPEALAERERRAWANRRLWVNSEGADGVVRGGFELDPVGGATLIAGLDALSRKTSAKDERTFVQRQADALVELARRALDGGELPQVAVQRPHTILIRTVEEWRGETDASCATLDGVGPVSAATAEMLCCDAEVAQVFMTRNGEVLDAGRTRKQPTRAQRVAVIARDKVCVGCSAPAARCQVHHVEWWVRDLGPTDEGNLCLVCWDCHFKIHHHDWDVIRHPDTGRFVMRPPGPPDIKRRAG